MKRQNPNILNPIRGIATSLLIGIGAVTLPSCSYDPASEGDIHPTIKECLDISAEENESQLDTVEASEIAQSKICNNATDRAKQILDNFKNEQFDSVLRDSYESSDGRGDNTYTVKLGYLNATNGQLQTDSVVFSADANGHPKSDQILSVSTELDWSGLANSKGAYPTESLHLINDEGNWSASYTPLSVFMQDTDSTTEIFDRDYLLSAKSEAQQDAILYRLDEVLIDLQPAKS